MFDYDEINKILDMQSDSDELLVLPLNLGECAENETEYNFAYEICLRLCKSDNADLRVNALLGLAYLARTQGQLDKEKVIPMIQSEWLNNNKNRGRIEDCIDDINIYLNWEIDTSEFLMKEPNKKEIISHDEIIEMLFSEAEKCDKKLVTDMFLAGLDDKMHLCCALPAYAIMKTFPRHSHTISDQNRGLDEKIVPCDICCDYKNVLIMENEYYEQFKIGAAMVDNLLYGKWYVLNKVNNSNYKVGITPNCYTIFSEILSALKNARPDEKIRDVHKRLLKSDFCKSWIKAEKGRRKLNGEKMAGVTLVISERLQNILEILGYCSVLSTELHKGNFYEYRSAAKAPRTSRSSDWAYPVDFWTGKDGINAEAFEFWFGEYMNRL